MSTQQLWIVTVPNGAQSSSEATANALQKAVSEGSLLRVHKFDIPNLTVGTLDSLMSLSDDLVKLNSQVEVCISGSLKQFSKM